MCRERWGGGGGGGGGGGEERVSALLYSQVIFQHLQVLIKLILIIIVAG